MGIRRLIFAILFFGLVLPPSFARAGEVMFEAYYRLDLQGKPIGYAIQRFEFDNKTKAFESKTFLRAKFGDKVMQESTVAKCTDKFKPIAYQYTSQLGAEMKMIDATFKGEVMTASINDGKVVRNETSKVPKGTFLSSFLPYLLLQRKLVIHEGFQYSAVAEEDAASYTGRVLLESKEPKPGYDTFTVLNRFKGEDFVSKMAVVRDPTSGKNIKGEVLATETPAKGFSTHLVATPNQATEGQVVPNQTLLKVFGNIPTGKVNLVTNPASVAPQVPNLEPGPKVIPTPVPPTEEEPPKKTKSVPKSGR
jgi:hypothetical protein